MRTVDLIGVAMGLGGPDTAAAGGPARLRRAKLAEHLNELGVTTHWSPRLHPEPLAEQTAAARRDVSTELNGRVAHRITQSLGIGRAPWVLGGDHSIAAGTWAGVARSVGGPGKIGLVWIDAHMDAHTPATTPSGNPHGMPLATLLGADGSVPAVTPEHVALIGVRS